ncbi:MAG: nuclear transport factor 2 family protein [Chitinophagaceae bacterium]|nr:nuclear transport factor 2 family protein [Chitinophagaceae bacterium]
MKRLISFLYTIIGMVCFASVQSADEKAILKVLNDQVYYWNKGDLDNFVKGYWNNDSVMFIGSKGIVYGYQNTLNRYKQTYSDTAKMGKLSFKILHVNKLSSDTYFVAGKFFLKRTIGDAEGHYTLVFRKINGTWKIISDHSS